MQMTLDLGGGWATNCAPYPRLIGVERATGCPPDARRAGADRATDCAPYPMQVRQDMGQLVSNLPYAGETGWDNWLPTYPRLAGHLVVHLTPGGQG